MLARTAMDLEREKGKEDLEEKLTETHIPRKMTFYLISIDNPYWYNLQNPSLRPHDRLISQEHSPKSVAHISFASFTPDGQKGDGARARSYFEANGIECLNIISNTFFKRQQLKNIQRSIFHYFRQARDPDSANFYAAAYNITREVFSEHLDDAFYDVVEDRLRPSAFFEIPGWDFMKKYSFIKDRLDGMRLTQPDLLDSILNPVLESVTEGQEAFDEAIAKANMFISEKLASLDEEAEKEFAENVERIRKADWINLAGGQPHRLYNALAEERPYKGKSTSYYAEILKKAAKGAPVSGNSAGAIVWTKFNYAWLHPCTAPDWVKEEVRKTHDCIETPDCIIGVTEDAFDLTAGVIDGIVVHIDTERLKDRKYYDENRAYLAQVRSKNNGGKAYALPNDSLLKVNITINGSVKVEEIHPYSDREEIYMMNGKREIETLKALPLN
jgi:hypothetical protein